MDLATFKDQISAPGVAGKVQLMSVLRTMSEDGCLVEAYRPYLESADTYQDFLEAVYEDSSMVMDDVWGLAAKVLHPEDALAPFTPLGVVKEKPVVGSAVVFSTAKGDLSIRAPRGYAACDVYVFADGTLNEMALAPAGKLAAVCTIAGVDINGVFNVYHHGGNIVIMPWDVDACGNRPHMRVTSQVRLRNTVKPKSNNC